MTGHSPWIKNCVSIRALTNFYSPLTLSLTFINLFQFKLLFYCFSQFISIFFYSPAFAHTQFISIYSNLFCTFTTLPRKRCVKMRILLLCNSIFLALFQFKLILYFLEGNKKLFFFFWKGFSLLLEMAIEGH